MRPTSKDVQVLPGARPQYDANAAVDRDEGGVPKHYQMWHLSRGEKVCEVVMHVRSLATSDSVLGDQSQPRTLDYCVLLCNFFYQELMLSMLRILVFHIQFLFLIPDSRAVYDLIFTLFILLITR